MSDIYNFDDFQFKPVFNKIGELKGFTQKVFDQKHYYGKDGNYKWYKVKNDITNKSDYYDSSNGYLGSSIKKLNDMDYGFIKSDGTLGHTPKMFDLKDPNFHNNVHSHFSKYRANLLSKLC